MDGYWQLQTAKNRFSEVVQKARTEGPQFVTLRGEEAVVVLSVDEYRALKGILKQSLGAYLLSMPKGDEGDEELDIERSRELPRDLDLA